MKKLSLLAVFLLAIPFVSADCGITNLASCLPEKLYEYTIGVINAPLQPFLTLTKNLLSEPVNVDGFLSLWAIITYLISLFYGLFLLFAGFNFLLSGYSALKREQAKEWIKNIVLMILFIQASFYLYTLTLEISSLLTTSILDLIDPNFFLLTIDNLANVGLQLVFSGVYLLTMVFSILGLSVRYMLVAIGVVFFPLGIFFNFIPPIKSYGRLIINTLMILIFLPFFQALLLLGASKLIEIPIFQNFKILVMTAAMSLVWCSMVFLLLFAIIKAVIGVWNSSVGQVTRIAAGALK
ncbi:hypothetical protein J4419_01990 [Candidatus Woesearchaeota archaeon]|nr:hypothetical protein [Candidatus Woesearchaeota archaeon]